MYGLYSFNGTVGELRQGIASREVSSSALDSNLSLAERVILGAFLGTGIGLAFVWLSPLLIGLPV